LYNYEDPDGSWNMEREEADQLQAEMEAQGRELSKRYRMSESLRADAAEEPDPMKREALLDAGAKVCPHGARYPVNSIAAADAGDPARGRRGDLVFRCCDCGSLFDQEGIPSSERYSKAGKLVEACSWMPPK
jgi:hypothetical protein